MTMFKKNIMLLFIIILIFGFSNNIYAIEIYEFIENDKTEKTLLLIDNNLDINISDEAGMTPLMYAIKYNNLLVIDKLLEFEAKTNIKDQYGKTPLMYAAQYSNNPQIIDKLIEVNRKEQIKSKKIALIFATLNTFDLNVIDALINTDKLINEQDKDGKTALMYAAMYNNMHIIDALIDLGADGTIKDDVGKSALDYAKTNKNIRESVIYSKLKEICTNLN